MTARMTQRRRVRDLRKYLAEANSPSAGHFGDLFATTGLRRVLIQAGHDPDKVNEVIERHQRFTPVAGADTRWRAQYLLKAAGRDDPQEGRYFTQHVQADYDRIFSKMRIQAATQQYGPLIGWYAKEDDRVTPECAYADGKNFDPTHPPPWGLPGIGTHHGCRCVPGPPHEGGEVMDHTTTNPGMHEHSGSPVARVVDMKFNPNQPRGWDGRWIKIGAGGKHDARLGDSRRKIKPPSSGQHTDPNARTPRVVDKQPTVRQQAPKPIYTAPKGPDKEAIKKAGRKSGVITPEEQERRAALQKRIEANRQRVRDEDARRKTGAQYLPVDDDTRAKNREEAKRRVEKAARDRNTKTPVSAAFGKSRITDEKTGREIDAAVAAIDGVHTDGRLPPLHPRTIEKEKNEHGHYQAKEGTADGLEDLVVNTTSPMGRYTTVHEIGHFIDTRALGGNDKTLLSIHGARRVMGMDKDEDTSHITGVAEMGRVMQRAMSSKGLNEGFDNAMKIAKAYPSEAEYPQYYASPVEIWGRAYAQYIAERSKDQTLLNQLRRQQTKVKQQRNRGYPVVPMVWDSQDFRPIAAAIDDLLKVHGWM